MVQKHFQWLPNEKLSWKNVILTIFDQRDFLRKIQTNSRISGCKHSKQISMAYFFIPWPTKTLGELSFFEVPEVSYRLLHLQLTPYLYIYIFFKISYYYLQISATQMPFRLNYQTDGFEVGKEALTTVTDYGFKLAYILTSC